MHARWLVEIATLFAVETSLPERTAAARHAAAAHRYWLVARQRFEAWQEKLSTHRDRFEGAGASRRMALWKSLRPTLEEIFLSDVLNRIVAAHGERLESMGVDFELGPIASNVYRSHEDIRHRSLRLLVSPGVPVEQAVELNRIRYSLEQWTDTFLAQLPSHPATMCYAFRPERMPDLLDDVESCGSEQERLVAWRLLIGSCQGWMKEHCLAASAHPELNHRLGEACLALLHPDRFPSFTAIPPLANDRLTTLIDQANLWVAQLLDHASAGSGMEPAMGEVLG